MKERQERPPGCDASIALMHRWCIKIVCFSGLTWISFYCNAVNSLNWKKFRDFESREQVFFSFASVVTKLTTQKTLFLEILKQGSSFWPSFQLKWSNFKVRIKILNLIWFFLHVSLKNSDFPEIGSLTQLWKWLRPTWSQMYPREKTSTR